VRLLLSAGNSFQRLSKLPPMLGNSAAVARLIEFEASQAVPYSMDEVEWGYQLLHHQWEEHQHVTNEDGDLKEELTTDGLHPDAEAKKIIGEAIGKYLRETFGLQ